MCVVGCQYSSPSSSMCLIASRQTTRRSRAYSRELRSGLLHLRVVDAQKWFGNLIYRTFPGVSVEILRAGYSMAEDLESDQLDVEDRRRFSQHPMRGRGRGRGRGGVCFECLLSQLSDPRFRDPSTLPSGARMIPAATRTSPRPISQKMMVNLPMLHQAETARW